MAEEEKKTESRDIHTSYKGTFKEGTLEVGKTKNGKDFASVTMIVAGKTGYEAVVKGYNKHVETLKSAVEAGGEQILRGQILNDKDGSHLAVYAVGPENVTGRIHNIRTSVGKADKVPFVAGYFVFDKPEEGNRRPSREIHAYGDAAVALAEVTPDHVVSVPVRGSRAEKTGRDGTPIKDESGKSTYEDILVVEGIAQVEHSPRKVAEADAPTP